MAIIVKKFGGTSVGSMEAFHSILQILKTKSSKDQIIVVASAMSKITDLLLQLGKESVQSKWEEKNTFLLIKEKHIELTSKILKNVFHTDCWQKLEIYFEEIKNLSAGITLTSELSQRTQDKLISYGELLSNTILHYFLMQNGLENLLVDSRKVFKTDAQYGNATLNHKKTFSNIKSIINEVKMPFYLFPGFIASAEDGSTTTMGRGGSDFTASVIAAAISADFLEIWTDVDGVMTADPRIVPDARIITHMSYQEAFELSNFGAKVLYPPTIQPVSEKNIPLIIKNTFAPEKEGTMIDNKLSSSNSIVCGISSIHPISLISIEGSGMVGIPGFSKRVFETLSQKGINVILITQASSEHSICVGIQNNDTENALSALTSAFEWEISSKKLNPIQAEKNLAILALVGDNMKNHTGVSGRMFHALGKNGVNIRAIAQGSSERNISSVISNLDVKKAINILHEEFFSSSQKQVNLYIAGIGNVGKKLLNILQNNKEQIQEEMNIDLCLAGLINSKNYLIKTQGISIKKWETDIVKGEKSDIQKFTDAILENNLRNSIFIDMTSHENVANTYSKLLKKSVNIVACNKIAASSSYENYANLKSLAKEYTTQFLFETNVGAALPILTTLKDLVSSGDKINRIDAVLSGTLNFVFNTYDTTIPFSDVVRRAQEEGYTEPDPRLDLTGKDVIRKLLILIREAGYVYEFEKIKCNGFLPEECLKGSVENFYKTMLKHESHFQKLYHQAQKKNCKLKFVATFNQGKASAGLQEIPVDHDLYNLQGKDNIVLFKTLRYADFPLVIKGAGAGADVTASGVFADILRACK